MKKIIIGVLVVCCFIGVVAFNVHKQTQKGDPEILIFQPMTGSLSNYAKHIKRGIDLWVEQNPDWKDKIKLVDSQGSPSVSVGIYLQERAMYKPKIIIASVTPVIHAIQPLAQKDGAFVLASNVSTASTIQKAGMNNIQRVYFNAYDSIEASVEMFAKFKKLALIYETSEFGYSEKKTIEEILAKHGKKLDVAESFESRQFNPREVVLKVLKEKPDAIMVVGTGLPYRNVFKNLNEQDYKGKMLTNAVLVDPAFWDEFKAYKNPVYFIGTSIEADKATEFKKTYEERFGTKACISAVSPYDALTLAKLMIEKNITTQEEIYKLGKMQGVIDEITFLPDGEMHYPTVLLKIGNGKVEQVNPDNE